MRSKHLVAATLLAFGLSGVASAGNILTIDGPDGDAENGYGGYNISSGLEYLAQSWTQTSEYDNVSISAAFANFLGDAGNSVTAYLTSSIGPSTTSAIATTTVSEPASGDAMVSLFSGLDLTAGTYYLVLQGDDPSDGDLWYFTSNSNIAGDAVYDGGEYYQGRRLSPPETTSLPTWIHRIPDA